MNPTSKIFLAGCIGILVAAQALAAPPAGPQGDPPAVKIQPRPVTQQQIWQLRQGTGPELYQSFCTSCHGLQGNAHVAVVRAFGAPPTDLTRLREAGISRQHVSYVLLSSCTDDVHRAPDGSPTMPCWRRILRNGLGSDAAVFPVVNRLVEYIDSIQETGEPEPPVMVAAHGN